MTATRAPRALLVTGGLVLALATGCGSGDGTVDTAAPDRGAPPAPSSAAAPDPSSPLPLSEVPGSASPVPTRALPRPTAPPQSPTDVVKARTVAGELTVRADGCRVLRDDLGVAYLLRGDAAAELQPGPVSLRGRVQVLDAPPCPGLTLVLGG